jgi:hypothetical protein
VVLGNHSPLDPAGFAYRIADLYLEAELAPQTEAEGDDTEPIEVQVPGAVLARYEGVYKLGPAWYVRISREGDRLHAHATAEEPVPMNARSETEFWVEDFGASLEFFEDESGRIAGFRYRGTEAPKLEDAPSPTPARMAQVAGEYVSEELGTSYTVTLQDEGLAALHRRHGTIRLVPAWKDDFRGDAWFLQSVEFQRNENGEVVGLLVNAGERNRNLRFEIRR